MNRFFLLYSQGWLAASLLLSGVGVGRAQVVIGPETAKIDWPTVSYAAIDVSSDVPGSSDVEQILLGEDGKVVFSYRTSHVGHTDMDPAADSDIDILCNYCRVDASSFTVIDETVLDLHVCQWKDGAITSNQSTKFRSHIEYSGLNPDTSEPIYLSLDYVFRKIIINYSGQVCGCEYVYSGGSGFQDFEDDLLFDGLIIANTGMIQRSGPPAAYQPKQYPTGFSPPFITPVSISSNGNTLVETQWPLVSYNTFDHTAYITGSSTLFARSYPSGSVQNGFTVVPELPFQVNKNGYAIGFGYPSGYIWHSIYNELDDGEPLDLNDSNQVVIRSEGTDGDPESGGYLWEDAGEQGVVKTRLRSKLPAYLQAQVKDVQPFMISDQGADGSIAILAMAKDGEEYVTVLCKRDGESKWTFAKASIPEGVNVEGINSSGVIIAIRNAETGGKHALILVSVLVSRYPLNTEINNGNRMNGTNNVVVGAVLKDVSSLKVAQWENAWNMNGTGMNMVDDFPEVDPDRFYIRIPSLGFDASQFKVRIKINGINGNTFDDWVEVDMQLDPKDSKMLISKSQLLVADAADKNLTGFTGSTSVTPELLSRIHKVDSLFSKLEVEVQSKTTDKITHLELNTSIQPKQVFLHLRVIRNTPGGSLPNGFDLVDALQDIVKHVGPVYLQADVNVVFCADFSVVDPPNNLDLSNGISQATANYIPDDVRSILDRLGTPDTNDIYVFYVASIKKGVPGYPNLGASAFTLFDSAFPSPDDKKYTSNIFIGTQSEDILTTAHELGHLLTNRGHIEEVPGGLSQVDLTYLHNLMYGAGILDIDRLHQSSIKDSKRLWNFQADLIRGNPHVK